MHIPLEVWVPGVVDPLDSQAIFRFGGDNSLKVPNLLRIVQHLLDRRDHWLGAQVYLMNLGAHWIFSHLWRFGLTGPTRMIPLFHGSEILRYESNPWLGYIMKDWFVRCERLAAASPFTLARLRQSRLVGANQRIDLAPCAVRSDLIPNPAAKRSEEDAPEMFRILVLARLHPRKGQLDAIRALALFPSKKRKKVVLQLVGTGEKSYELLLRKEAEQHQISVDFIGPVENQQLAEIYANCDLYLMSSRALPKSVEGFGMTYLEAGLFGKPVVGYRTGGVEGAVLHMETGILVEEGNIRALSDAVLQIWEDRPLREKLGRQGACHALSFKWEKTARSLFDS